MQQLYSRSSTSSLSRCQRHTTPPPAPPSCQPFTHAESLNETVKALVSPERRAKPARAPKLREASFKDHAQIASLESRHGLAPKDYDEWSHLWLGNPLYRELQAGWTVGWVLENEDNQIVASIGNIPLLYEFEGKRIIATSGRAWVADPAYRSFSPALLERVINQPGIDLYLNNTMTAEAAPCFRMFGCPRVPMGLWDESAFWITNYRGFLESFLVLKNCPLSKTLSYPLSAAVFLKDLFSKKALRDGEVEVPACSGFDERFDHFWAELKARNPHLLLAVRTREQLEWHYKYALLDHRLWILTVVRGSRLLAYATFERRDRPESGLKRMTLVDFQSLDQSTTFLLPLLFRALRKCQEERIHVLESMGRWLAQGELMEVFAPYRRKLRAWSYFYRTNNPQLAESLKVPGTWAPSLYDGNASLCTGFMNRRLSSRSEHGEVPVRSHAAF